MRRRSAGLVVLGVAALALAVHHPSADIRILTHDAGDPQPHRIQAAADLGLASVSLLVTWTAHRLAAH